MDRHLVVDQVRAGSIPVAHPKVAILNGEGSACKADVTGFDSQRHLQMASSVTVALQSLELSVQVQILGGQPL